MSEDGRSQCVAHEIREGRRKQLVQVLSCRPSDTINIDAIGEEWTTNLAWI